MNKLYIVPTVTQGCLKPGLKLSEVQDSINSTNKQLDPNREHTYHFIGGTASQRNQVDEVVQELRELVPGLKIKRVSTNGDTRISFVEGNGTWSFIGSDIYLINREQATMNIGWYEESGRHIKHEWGHNFSLLHEHLHPDLINDLNFEVLYEAFARQGWDKETVDRNFSVPTGDVHFDEVIDNDSLMKYSIKCEWTFSGKNCDERQNTTWSLRDLKRLNDLFPHDDVIVPPVEPKGCLELLKSLFPNKTRLNKLTESQVVLIANYLGLDSTTKDLKRDTVNKVIDKLH